MSRNKPVTVVEYSSMAYNTMPDAATAFSAFQNCQGELLVGRLMKDLFRKHKVQDRLGLVLLHKHCILNTGERMTRILGTKSPAPQQLGEPCTWKVNLADGRMIPVEFSMEAKAMDWHDLRLRVFVKEFLALLLQHQAHKSFGLCLYPGDGYPGHIELADGRNSVGLSLDEVCTPTLNDTAPTF
ncbi:hypothetical protein NLG97_g8043 [Lecanicillium saksenae]|uniref:Uncharacterized protein n=1 Tax=Lecanicillium saksenae TaxID=468837 RepID=A0ACC1QLZ7_9HYPO|nr:hypothetical protein NLG97_g8043 [Lecanicillium saksenae]